METLTNKEKEILIDLLNKKIARCNGDLLNFTKSWKDNPAREQLEKETKEKREIYINIKNKLK